MDSVVTRLSSSSPSRPPLEYQVGSSDVLGKDAEQGLGGK